MMITLMEETAKNESWTTQMHGDRPVLASALAICAFNSLSGVSVGDLTAADWAPYAR